MRSYYRRIVLISAILAAGWGFFSLSIGAGNFSHGAAESPDFNDAHASAVPVNGTPLPDTGQTQSYTSMFGEDSDYLINPPSYTKLDADGNDLPDSATEWLMVRDNVSQLIWEVKTDDGSIHDRHNTYTWQNAQNVFIPAVNAEQFGGYSDWRMPSIKELISIKDLGRYIPAINTDYFPNPLFPNHYWSSTTCAGPYDCARTVWVYYGSDGTAPKFYTNHARAVRGG